MHLAERNALQERVFPRLRELCSGARLPLPGHRPALGRQRGGSARPADHEASA